MFHRPMPELAARTVGRFPAIAGLMRRRFYIVEFHLDDEPSLDEGSDMHLRPDLLWRDGARYVFVGDTKYKNVAGGLISNADLYQLLEYVTALDLPCGLLIYARGDADAAKYQVRHSGKRLEVAALDLSGTLDEILERVGSLSEVVRESAVVAA